jgi:hypothetical protein
VTGASPFRSLRERPLPGVRGGIRNRVSFVPDIDRNAATANCSAGATPM